MIGIHIHEYFFTQITKLYLNAEGEYFYHHWYCVIPVCMLSAAVNEPLALNGLPTAVLVTA